ncbi:integrase, catalytic region, zinc finger, CCHC-type containing protein [Tanacetum coccineum]|uniref:Integrase, catalytic region, zinc finger, CCHC-type containing protein n=1 Tax=Tanacetum coccineum TaxID=301880 RepID=A0ABQ5B021_9ASTR
MLNSEDILDPTMAMNMALVLVAKAFKLKYSTPTNNNQRISSNPRNRQIAQPGMNTGQDRQMQMVKDNCGKIFRIQVFRMLGNQNGVIVVPGIANPNANQNRMIRCYNCKGLGHYARNCTAKRRMRNAAFLQTQLLIAQKEEAGI